MNKKIITATMIVLTASSSSSISSSSSSASSTSSSQTENIDDRTLAVLVGLQYGEEWFKSALDNPECITLTQSVANSDGGTNSEFSDFSAISAHGDASSLVYFKRDGNNVIYTTFEVGENQAMYQGHYVKNTIPMDELIENYYQTSSQKAEIAEYASQLKNQRIQNYLISASAYTARFLSTQKAVTQ